VPVWASLHQCSRQRCRSLPVDIWTVKMRHRETYRLFDPLSRERECKLQDNESILLVPSKENIGEIEASAEWEDAGVSEHIRLMQPKAWHTDHCLLCQLLR
jgi:hypothetical protein